MELDADKKRYLEFSLTDKWWVFSFTKSTGEFKFNTIHMQEYLMFFFPDCPASWYVDRIENIFKYRNHNNIQMLVGYFHKYIEYNFIGEKYTGARRIQETEEYRVYQKEQFNRVEDLCKAFRVNRKRPLRQEEIDELKFKWALRKLEQ